jgi:hypothetical protein
MAAARLLAKRQGPFAQDMKVPFIVGPRTKFGPSIENAATNHQKNIGMDKGLFETSGVSATTDRRIAVRFATDSGTRSGYVATIRRDLLEKYGVSEFDVLTASSEVQKPEDKEVILFTKDGEPFPVEIIEAYESVAASEFRG